MLINTETNTRVWEHDFKAGYPNTSFPELLTDAVVTDFGHAVLVYPAQPLVSRGQNVIDNGHAHIDGKWQVQWSVIEKTADELAGIATGIRADRNARLSACDWTQVADAPVDVAAWATYRQALRDVPAQAGFPLDVAWPTQSE